MILIDPEPNCFISNRDFNPTKKGSGNTSDVESAFKCQKHCQMRETCQTFVYWPSTKICHYKKGELEKGDIVLEDGPIIGPKYCGE